MRRIRLLIKYICTCVLSEKGESRALWYVYEFPNRRSHLVTTTSFRGLLVLHIHTSLQVNCSCFLRQFSRSCIHQQAHRVAQRYNCTCSRASALRFSWSDTRGEAEIGRQYAVIDCLLLLAVSQLTHHSEVSFLVRRRRRRRRRRRAIRAHTLTCQPLVRAFELGAPTNFCSPSLSLPLLTCSF